MSELPPGFVIQGAPQAQPPQNAGLPEGFEIQGQPAEHHQFGWEDTWPAKLAKAVYSGLTLPGDVAQGNVSITGEDGHTNPEVINRSWEAANTGLVGAPVALTHAAGAVAAPAREALAHAADLGYKAARELGVELSPKAVTDLGTKISSKLEGYGITDELAPKTFSLLKKIASPPEDAVATIGNMDALRRSFGHATQDFANPTEQLAAHKAIDHLDEFLADLPAGSVLKGDGAAASKILQEARGNYGAAKRSERVTDALETADRNAAVTHSGQNIGNANRQSLNSILKSDKKSSGFSPEELEKMDAVARGSPLGNATRVLGNLFGGGGGMGALHAAAAGATAGGAAGGLPGAALGLATPLVGAGFKKLSDLTIKRGAEQLDELVRSRSPLAQAMAATVPKRVPMSAPAMIAGRNVLEHAPVEDALSALRKAAITIRPLNLAR